MEKKYYGKLLVTRTFKKKIGASSRGTTFAMCLCKCGGKITRPYYLLKKGNVKSCGCLRVENALIRAEALKLTRKNYRHGMEKTRPYRIWMNMKQRCSNPKHKSYKAYGGRGITLCKKWNNFADFWKDMEDGYADHLSLDRVNNEIGYCKENCRWATPKEQSNNMRCNVKLTFKGETLSPEMWAEKLGINVHTLRSRMQRKLPIEKIISKNLYKL